jgi:hypothetical protein
VTTGLKARSFRQVVVPKPISLLGGGSNDSLVVVGMPCAIDSVIARLWAPANLTSVSGKRWNDPGIRGVVQVQLFQPGAAVVFEFMVPTHFQESKRYVPPLEARDIFDSALPLLARARQVIPLDTDPTLPDLARVEIVVNLIPDFYEGLQ